MITKPSLHCFEPKIIFQPSEEGFSNKSDFEMRRLRKFLQIIKNCIFEKCHHFRLNIDYKLKSIVQFNILILHLNNWICKRFYSILQAFNKWSPRPEPNKSLGMWFLTWDYNYRKLLCMRINSSWWYFQSNRHNRKLWYTCEEKSVFRNQDPSLQYPAVHHYTQVDHLHRRDMDLFHLQGSQHTSKTQWRIRDN